MNLLDRARGCGIPAVQGLLQEMAGEVERLWAFEKEFNEVILPAWNATRDSLHESMRKLEEEIVLIKSEVDTEGMARHWLEGYRMAAGHFQPILFNLLRASDVLPEGGVEVNGDKA